MSIRTLCAGALVIHLAGCFGSPPPSPNREKIMSADGKWLEQRIVRHLSRRPKEIFFVYRDSAGNYIRHGADTRYYLNGQVQMEEHYRGGLLDSITEFWYPNGNKRGELPYSGGKPHGKAMTWYPNGKKESEKNWEQGLLEGLSTEWDEKGAVRNTTLWKQNKIEKVVAP